LPHLYVSVRLNDLVAEQRLVVVGDGIWLGSCPEAAVSFPGPALRVVERGNALQVQGRWLRPGRPVRMRRGSLEVSLEAVPQRQLERRFELPVPDLRVLVASAAVVLLGAWWEAVGAFLDRHPDAMATLAGAAPVIQPAGLHTPDGVGEGAEQAAGEPRADADPRPCYPCEEPPVGARPPVGFVILE